ncbi:MAG: hypothetical protein ACLUB3_08725 [Clostridium sp.]
MNRKKWICTAAAITGLLLAVIAGLSIRHMKNSSYVSASELAGQKSGSVSEKLEENGNEDLAESSESKNGQPDGKQDQEMVLVQKRMRTVEIAALDRTRMKKLPKMIAVQVSQKMTARRVRLSLKQSQRISW